MPVTARGEAPRRRARRRRQVDRKAIELAYFLDREPNRHAPPRYPRSSAVSVHERCGVQLPATDRRPQEPALIRKTPPERGKDVPGGGLRSEYPQYMRRGARVPLAQQTKTVSRSEAEA
jgi:hypothetical protein